MSSIDVFYGDSKEEIITILEKKVRLPMAVQKEKELYQYHRASFGKVGS